MIAGLWAAFKGSKIAGYLAIAGAIVVGLLLLVGKLMGAGKAQEKAAAAERIAKKQETADEVDRMVERAGDGELDELRSKWTRR